MASNMEQGGWGSKVLVQDGNFSDDDSDITASAANVQHVVVETIHGSTMEQSWDWMMGRRHCAEFVVHRRSNLLVSKYFSSYS